MLEYCNSLPWYLLQSSGPLARGSRKEALVPILPNLFTHQVFKVQVSLCLLKEKLFQELSCKIDQFYHNIYQLFWLFKSVILVKIGVLFCFTWCLFFVKTFRAFIWASVINYFHLKDLKILRNFHLFFHSFMMIPYGIIAQFATKKSKFSKNWFRMFFQSIFIRLNKK